MRLRFVVPDRGGLGPSGGDRYDAAVVAAWRAAGHSVEVVPLPGSWPWPGEADLAALGRALEADDTRPGGTVLVDGLVAGAAPGQIEAAADRGRLVVLVHSVLSEGAGARGADAEALDRGERAALAAADVVVATSRFAVDDLARRYGLEGVVAVPPGVTPAQISAGAGHVPQLLSLGAVTPVKNHGLLLTALEQVVDLPWSLVVAGPAPDPRHLRTLQHDADQLGLTGRVTWLGPLGEEELEPVWARTDLLVHVSRYETYGMVVAEAHAHGVPTVVGAGTGAVEALQGRGDDEPPGVAVPTDDPRALAEVLREWLGDRRLRARWWEAAVHRRQHLRTWEDVAAELAAAVRPEPAR